MTDGYPLAKQVLRDQRGVTLIELIVVVSIVGALIVAMGLSFQGWIGKYKVESRIKEMHVDLMKARSLAMQHARVHFADIDDIDDIEYLLIYEDTSPDPDGNGTLEVGSDELIVQKETGRTITSTFASLPVSFNRNGIASASGVFRYESDDNPDYDCVDIFSTRINLGKWDDGTNTCIAK
jgi:prepilin-type N-terminal cleavage/methylation domain-containing protein